MHWEQYNVAYVQSFTALGLVESLLNELFDFYDKSDNHQQEYDTIDDHEMFALGALRAGWFFYFHFVFAILTKFFILQ